MLTVICPSRGRPEAAAEVAKTFQATCVDLDTKLFFVVPEEDGYPTFPGEPSVWTYRIEPGCCPGMVSPLNAAVRVPAIVRDSAVVGFVGDDHRFLTPGWDAAIEDWLTEHPGIVYANDGFEGVEVPAQWFFSRPIASGMGMGPPNFRHLFVGHYWKALGSAAGCLYYLPDIVIEHRHEVGPDPARSAEAYAADWDAYQSWLTKGKEGDVARLLEVLR